MKKATLLLLTLVAFATLQTKAQTHDRNYWSVSVGAGISGSGYMVWGFAKGVSLEYNHGIFSMGLSAHNAGSQHSTTENWKAYAHEEFYYNTKKAMVGFKGSPQLTNRNLEWAMTSSLGLNVGVNIMKWIQGYDTRHNLVVSVMGGMGMSGVTMVDNKPSEGLTISLEHGIPLTYGARGSYEYRITDRMGIGASFTYDIPQENGYALANLVVRF